MTNNLNTLLSNLSNTFDLINDAFKKNADPVLTNYSITEMHCIEHIKKIKNPNVTKLSASLRITRGGVCKIIKRLCAKSAVSPYRLDENKKEIYYTLTETGEKIFLAHEKIHQKWLEKDSDFLKQFNKKDVEFALKFIQKYSDHLKKSLTGFEWRKK